MYLLQGDFEKSKKKYFEGIKLIERDTSLSAIEIKADLYYNLAFAKYNLKEYQAYDELITSIDAAQLHLSPTLHITLER